MSIASRPPRPTVLLIAACAVQIATYGTYFNLTPLYPSVGRDLHVDPGTLGILVGAGGIVSLLIQLPAGSGGDAYGRRPFFAAGMVCLAFALLLRWQTVNPLMLLIAQLGAGAALGMCSLNAFALAADVATGHDASRSIGIVNASVSVGQVVGYLIAGALGPLLGWHDLSLVMLLIPAAVLGLVLWLPDLRARSGAGQARPGPVAVVRALSHPRRLAFSGLGALTLGAGSGAAYLLPFALHAGDFGPLLAAIVLVPYVLGSVIAAPFSGDLAVRWGATRVVTVALATGALVCLSLVFAGAWVAALAVANIVLGMAVNSTLPICSMLVVRMKVGRDPIGPGIALAGLRVGMSLGPFIGPSLAGAALTRGGPEAAWIALGTCLLGSLGLFAYGSRTTTTT